MGEELARINGQFFDLNKKLANQEVFNRGKEEVINAGFASVNSQVDEHHLTIAGLARVLNDLVATTAEMQGLYDVMEHEIDSMEDRLCCCARKVPIEEEGGPEYESSNVFVIAPACPSLSTPLPPSVPQENVSPIPVPPLLPSSSSDIEYVAPPVADRPATPLPVCCPLKTLCLAPYTCRRRYPHTIVTGIVVDGVRYHRVEDIPRQ